MAESISEEALRCYRLASESYENQYKREVEDLKFQVPELQWDPTSREARTGGGGPAIPPRPILSIPKLDQPIQLVLNQEKQAHLGVNIHPLSEEANDETAEVLQGLYRKIERDSNAGIARSWAFDRAVKAGRGAYRVNTRYDDSGGHPFDQKITIERILYQAAVKFDPAAQEADYSDGEYAFITSWVHIKTFKRLYPKASLSHLSSSGNPLGFEDLSRLTPEWVRDEGDDKSVMVAEYFKKEHSTETVSQMADGSVVVGEVPKGAEVLQSRQRDKITVWWYKLAPGGQGLEEVEPAQEWNGQYIPIIPVIGRELQPFDKDRRWTGVIGPARDAQRLYNFAASTAVEVAALEPKAPFIGAEGQFEGHEAEWKMANIRNWPYLEYKPTSLGGQPMPPPQRTQVDMGRLGPSMQLLQQADDFIQSTTFTPDPALGNLNSRDRSGKAIEALQGQSDASTSHYMHSLSQISIMYEARVILDMIPKIYDRAGRVAQILGMDEEPRSVMLNAPFVTDPEGRPQQVPVPGGLTPAGVNSFSSGGPPGPPGAGSSPPKPKTFDLTKGSYGVSVTVGKSWQTRLQQGSDEIGQILQQAPALMPLIGPVYFRFRDFPGAKEIAEILKKVQAQQYPGLKDEDEPDDVDALKAKLSQQQMQMQQMQQAGQELQKQIETDQAKQQATLQKAQIDSQTKLKMVQAEAMSEMQSRKMEAEIEAVLAENEAKAEKALQAMKQEFERARQDDQQAFLAMQGELDRKQDLMIKMLEKEEKDKDADSE